MNSSDLPQSSGGTKKGVGSRGNALRVALTNRKHAGRGVRPTANDAYIIRDLRMVLVKHTGIEP